MSNNNLICFASSLHHTLENASIDFLDIIVRKGVSTSPLLGSPHFLKSPIPHLIGKSIIQVFLINRSATMKLSLRNTIHVKQQHNVGLFICKFTLKYMWGIIKYMLGNVYIISFYCREGSISLLYPKESFKCNFKTARKKRFFNGATSSWFLYVTM